MTINTTPNTMRGLFFVIKGQYRRDKSGDDTIGYDPFNPDTSEWYMLVDNKTFTCVSCGSDLKKVLQGVYKSIKRHKGDANKYFRQVAMLSSKVSIPTQEVYKRVYREFGDYFEDEVREMEDLAYEDLKMAQPIFKSKRVMEEGKKHLSKVTTTPVKKKVLETPSKTLVTPKKVRGIKKLSLV